MVDVLVVDHVSSTVLLVEATVLAHEVVQASDHHLGEDDERQVVHHPGGCPVHGVLWEQEVPGGVEYERERACGEDEKVLLPHRPHRWRASQLCVGLTSLVCCVRSNIERADVFP